jgi:LysR family transcriptional regulator, transcriptional activator of the cysJI operon
VLEDLANDVIDMALVEGIVESSDFIVEEYADDELILVCSPEHTWEKQIPIEELLNERMILRESGSGTRLIVENMLRENGILDKIDSYMELGSTQAIKSAVEAGLGVSILPRLTVERELQLNLLHKIDIDGVAIMRKLWLVKKRQRFNKTGVSSFIEFIQNQ